MSNPIHILCFTYKGLKVFNFFYPFSWDLPSLVHGVFSLPVYICLLTFEGWPQRPRKLNGTNVGQNICWWHILLVFIYWRGTHPGGHQKQRFQVMNITGQEVQEVTNQVSECGDNYSLILNYQAIIQPKIIE